MFLIRYSTIFGFNKVEYFHHYYIIKGSNFSWDLTFYQAFNDIIKLKTQTLIANALEEDGKTIWCKPDGTAYKDGILNASLETILQNELQSVLHKNTQGGGAGNTPTASGDFNGSQVIVQEATFKTQEQFLSEFDKIAQRKGIPKGDEYNKLYWEAFERYNVSTLREY